MKSLILPLSVLASILLFASSSCKKDSHSCGCSAESVGSIKDSIGWLEYDSIDKSYQINGGKVNSLPTHPIFWLCNPEEINDSIKTKYLGKQIMFSGELKPMCKSDYKNVIATVTGQNKISLTTVTVASDNN